MDHKTILPSPPSYPKECKTAHAFFLEEYRKNPFASLGDTRHQAYLTWSTMEDKSHWEKMAQDELERYEKEKIIYEEYQKRVKEIHKERSEKNFLKSIPRKDV
uniref:HMG box domain-containing protein n=1 Tax=Acrobeloides nanus TaxID=290746 RepID=A0A914BV32_9BILA